MSRVSQCLLGLAVVSEQGHHRCHIGRGPLSTNLRYVFDCGKKAALLISWSSSNPGRRYHSCYNTRKEGRSFWRWSDSEPGACIKQLLLDLRDVVWVVRDEIEGLDVPLHGSKNKLFESKDKHINEIESLTTRDENGSECFRIPDVFSETESVGRNFFGNINGFRFFSRKQKRIC
uniref:Zinc finger GRF-type domain-containing protein n=1 Tax=Oryza punctata TaxID=4537 RepID=A0A0E0JJD2_ORYPU